MPDETKTITAAPPNAAALGHGGARAGAGRLPGPKPGMTSAGREFRAHARNILADIIGTEKDPLLLAINIAADPKLPAALRLEAALGACKYVHPQLTASHVSYQNVQTNASEVLERLTIELDNYQDVPLIEVDANLADEITETLAGHADAASVALADLLK